MTTSTRSRPRTLTRALGLCCALAVTLSACSGTAEPAGPPATTPSSTPSSASSLPSTGGGASAAPTGTAQPPAQPQPATTAGTGGALPTVHVDGTIATGLTTPWGLGFLPDGTALVTERDTGKLLAISADAGHSVGTVGIVSGVVPGGEGGLLGLAVSPSFESNRTVYVYYTARSDNRVAALTLDPGHTRITGQRDILTGIPKASIHNGGRMLVAPGGSLFIGTGDAGQADRAQQLDSLGGKILHITPDGGPVDGHPFPDAPLVYSYGHRNVQGLAFDASGQLWASEFGASAYDELNRIEPGGNYGWPVVEGPSDDPRFVAPVYYWRTSEASPSGLAIVGETALMAALRGSRLWLIPLTGAAGERSPEAVLDGRYGRLRTVVVAPDGTVWLTTSNTDGRGTVRPGDDRILRLSLR